MPTSEAALSFETAHPSAVRNVPSPLDVVTGASLVRRGIQVLQAAWRHLLAPRLTRSSRRERAQRMQALLEELGGAWIKLGQALALRFDILPADYCLQFFQLLNQVRPFPAAAVRDVIEHELGRPVEELFRSFEWQPLAAASIGQVHRAELPDGSRVAVKVQRPEIRGLIRADLQLMRWVAGVLDRLPFLGALRARLVVNEFARWTEEELDYRMEARHAAVLREQAAGDALEHNPRVFSAYTTARVLTLEYLAGVPVIDIIAAIRNRNADFLEALAARGHDPRRMASHIVWNALNQIYRFGYFHADPHPANLIILDGDAIGYVDFGIVGKLDPEATDSLRYFAQCLFAGHIAKAVDEFMRFVTPSRRTDLAAARGDLIEALKSYLESERVTPGGFSPSESVFEIEMLAIVRKHGMALAPDAVRYLKAVLTAEAMVKELDPQFDLRGHENRFFGRLMQIELTEAVRPSHVAQWLLDARFRVDRVLESLESVREAPAQLAAVARSVRRRVQVFSLLTIVAGIVGLAVMPAPSETASTLVGRPIHWLVFAIAAMSLALLVLSILQVRRLPVDPAGDGSMRYPRRMR